jgi:hypothetical protein
MGMQCGCRITEIMLKRGEQLQFTRKIAAAGQRCFLFKNVLFEEAI